jgi:hypothetical protein
LGSRSRVNGLDKNEEPVSPSRSEGAMTQGGDNQCKKCNGRNGSGLCGVLFVGAAPKRNFKVRSNWSP